jgi:hypothetical protein
MLKEIVDSALPGFATLLAAILSLATAAAIRWISAHTTNTKVQGVETRLVNLVSTVVAEANQTLVQGLKDSKEFDSTAGKEIMAKVLATLQSHLGEKGLKEAKDVLRPDDWTQMLTSMIEAEVAKQKLIGPTDVPPPAIVASVQVAS